MCELFLIKKEHNYSVVMVKNGKTTKYIAALHDKKSETLLKGKFNVKLGSPIKESTMEHSYPEVLEMINFRRTNLFRFVDNLGKLG